MGPFLDMSQSGLLSSYFFTTARTPSNPTCPLFSIKHEW